METAISQKKSFLGVNYCHIYCNNIYPGSLNVLYFFLGYGILYEQCKPPATAKGSCHMSHDVWLADLLHTVGKHLPKWVHVAVTKHIVNSNTASYIAIESDFLQ